MNIKDGIYPTMITPYKNGEIDYDTVRKLVDFYAEKGCAGIFAVCQSSEMQYLSLKEKVRLAKEVVEQSAGRLNVVASGHTSTSLEEQAEEINAVSETGIDAFVWVSNRLDLHNDGDNVWIENAEKLLEKTNKEIPLGIYECPKPYKRLLSPEILRWCVETKRFAFIKDTCCDPDLLKKRIELLKGSGCKLYNANGQTLLTSIKAGGNGYSGIMANFHPDLFAWLFENYRSRPEEAEELSAILSMASFTESPAYPCTAKYYLQFEGIPMETFARSADEKLVTEYQKEVMKQLYYLNEQLRKRYIRK